MLFLLAWSGDVVVAGVVVVAAVSLIWAFRCVIFFLAGAYCGFLAIVGVDGVVLLCLC